MFKRQIYHTLLGRLKESRRFIQAITGPRQVGKTTMVFQVIDELQIFCHYASADEPSIKQPIWIEQQWEFARLELKKSVSPTHEVVLLLDEIQKIPNWSETIKRLWDEDTKKQLNIKVVLLGSAPLLMQQGLTESLAGRFEQIPATHWSYEEMREAFNWSIEQYIYFGGYPGAATLIDDENRWRHYINDSLIETTISRDILLMNRIHKPALLRNLFDLGCHYSGQILSYQKMTGQLQDVGNTTTLSHYLTLLTNANMITGLSKIYLEGVIKQRVSSPKLQVFNTALMSAQSPIDFAAANADRRYWGRLVESAVGAYLLNSCIGTQIKLTYWRDANKEVDFVISLGKQHIGIEVKSGITKNSHAGLEAFAKQFKAKTLVVGSQSLSLEKFLLTPITEWFK